MDKFIDQKPTSTTATLISRKNADIKIKIRESVNPKHDPTNIANARVSK